VTVTQNDWKGLRIDDFRAAAARWLASEASAAPSDYGAIVPEAELSRAVEWQHRLAEAGLVGLHWPERWGGQGLAPAYTEVWLEECAKAAVPPFLNMVGLVLTAEALLAYGTDEQLAAHLPGLQTGERVWCQLFSEPEAGSDLAHLRTRATRTDSGWLIEGEKVWTSNGHIADWGICLARTDPEASAHAGISFFLVDMATPGIECRPLRQITGTSEFDQVILDRVEVPPASLVGEAGQGWAVAMSTLTHERNHIGALAIRLGLRIEELVSTLPSDRVLRDRAVSSWAKGRALVSLANQRDRLGPAAASLMKLGVAQLSVQVANLSADGTGAAAMLAGPESNGLLSSLAGEIAGGTTQIQKTIVGERLLGLAREPAASR
jgi:alkylation response protein AidB-like acyl-CoA dehydrogenase